MDSGIPVAYTPDDRLKRIFAKHGCVGVMSNHATTFAVVAFIRRFNPFYHETIPCLLERIGDFEENIVDAVMLNVMTAK